MIKEKFKRMDTSGDKLLEMDEWIEMMETEGATEVQARRIFTMIDQTNSGTISLAELDLFIVNLTIDAVRKKFRAVDKDHSGQVDKKEFKKFFQAEGMKDGKIAKLWKKIDTDHSGKVSYGE